VDGQIDWGACMSDGWGDGSRVDGWVQGWMGR
jgi:hypothetical protein